MKRIDPKSVKIFCRNFLRLFLCLWCFDGLSQNGESNGATSYRVHDEPSYTSAHELISAGVEDAREYVRIGQSLIEEKPELAQGFFWNAIRLRPDVYKSYSYLYFIKIKNGDYDSARWYAEKAVEFNPRSPQTHLDLSLALARLRQIDDAKREVQVAATIDPDYVTRVGAKYITDRNSISGALFYFSSVYSVAPEHVLNNINYSYALRLNSQFQVALNVLSGVFEHTSQHDQYFDVAYGLYFKLLFDQGKYREIIATASTKVDQTYAQQYFFKALSHYKLEQSNDFNVTGEKYFSSAAKRPPSSLQTWATEEIKKMRVDYNRSKFTSSANL